MSDRGRVVERAADGKPIRFLGTHMDITERKRAAAVSAAMLEISGAEQKGTGLDDFLVAVHAAVGRLMDAKNFYVALHDPAADLLHFPYQIDEEAPPWAPFPPGDGPISRVLRSGKALLATPEGLEGFLRRGEVKPSGPIPRYWLGAPLIVGNTTIGVLVVQTLHGRGEVRRVGEERPDPRVAKCRAGDRAQALRGGPEGSRRPSTGVCTRAWWTATSWSTSTVASWSSTSRTGRCSGTRRPS